MLHKEKFFDCNKKAYLLKPVFNKKTFNYQPHEEEIHDFSHFLAYKVSNLLNTETRVAIKEELKELQVCHSAKFIEIEFNVLTASISINIRQGYETIIPIYSQTFKDLDVTDWNENHIFMKGLNKLFKKVEASF